MNDAVQLWHIPLEVPDTILSRYWAYLSEDEKTRGDRFRFEKDKRRFVVARGTLRCLLAKQLAQSPSAVQFCYGNYGKPALVRSGERCDFHFNLSHSGERALCALGGDRTVGVDIEYLKDIKRLDGMMERCLTEAELSDVKQQSETHQLEAFLQRWTCKEAYLKAIGLGLTQSMQSVEVRFNPTRFTSVPQPCVAEWHLSTIEVPASYVAALVTEGSAELEINHWQHP